MLQVKNKILLLAIFLFAGAGIIIAQNNGPSAFVIEAVKDAGEINNNENLIHDFIIRNNGNAPLLITVVKAACGCTATKYDKIIAPGKTGKIHSVTNISAFAGPVSKDITVFTNDPVNPLIHLTSKGKVMAAGNRPGQIL